MHMKEVIIDELCKKCVEDCKQLYELISCPKYKRQPHPKPLRDALECKSRRVGQHINS